MRSAGLAWPRRRSGLKIQRAEQLERRSIDQRAMSADELGRPRRDLRHERRHLHVVLDVGDRRELRRSERFGVRWLALVAQHFPPKQREPVDPLRCAHCPPHARPELVQQPDVVQQLEPLAHSAPVPAPEDRRERARAHVAEVVHESQQPQIAIRDRARRRALRPSAPLDPHHPEVDAGVTELACEITVDHASPARSCSLGRYPTYGAAPTRARQCRFAGTSCAFPASGRRDLNPGPPAPKAGALPGCATPRSGEYTGGRGRGRRTAARARHLP